MDEAGWQSLVARLAVEHWRLIRALIRASGGLDERNAGRLQAQARYAERQLEITLEGANLTLAFFDGELFEAGLPVDAINIDDFQPEDTLIVDTTVEPTVVAEGRVILVGRVHIARSGKSEAEDGKCI